MRQLPWLPPGTLTSPRAARPIAQLVDAWRALWFVGGGWRTGMAFTRPTDGDWSVLRQGEGGDLMGRPKAMQELAFAILGVRPRLDTTPADLTLLRRLAGAALDDLHAAIETACPTTATGGARWRLTIGPDGGRSLAIDLAEEALAAVARRTFAAIAPTAPLASRRDAIAGRRIACAAHLGATMLSVQQLNALEPGDVIILDQQVSDVVPLAIAGHRSDLQVALGDGGATISLQD